MHRADQSLFDDLLKILPFGVDLGSALRGKHRLQESIARQVEDRSSSKHLKRCLAKQLQKNT